MVAQEQARIQRNAIVNSLRASPLAQDPTSSKGLNDRTISFQSNDDILGPAMVDCGSRIANGLYNRPVRPLIKAIKCSHII